MPTGLSAVLSDWVAKRLPIPSGAAQRHHEAQQSPGTPFCRIPSTATLPALWLGCESKHPAQGDQPDFGCGTACLGPGQGAGQPARSRGSTLPLCLPPPRPFLPAGPGCHRAPPAAAPGAAARGLPRRRRRPRPVPPRPTRCRLPGSRIRARPQCAPPGRARRRRRPQGAAETISAGAVQGRRSPFPPRIRTAFLAPQGGWGGGGRGGGPGSPPPLRAFQRRRLRGRGRLRAPDRSAPRPWRPLPVRLERRREEEEEERGEERRGGGGERREGVGEQEGSCEPVWG